MNVDYLGRRLHFVLGNAHRLATAPWRQHVIAPAEASTIFGCSFGNGWNHLCQTLRDYDENQGIHFTETALGQFLSRFCPTSICDLLPMNVSAEDVLPLFTYPWGTFRKGETESSKDPRLSRFCGPSTEKFIADEFNRTIALYRQLRESGYRPWSFGHSFIGGTMLVANDGSRRFVVLQGNHRLAILAHLGYERIAVRDVPGFLSSVRENEVERWPLVADGKCSSELALAIFKMFFSQNGEHVLRLIDGVFYPLPGDPLHA